MACALLLPGCGGEETEDTVVDAVPSSARGYLHLDRDSDDWREAREALARVPALEAALLDALTGAVEVSGDGEAGVALVPKPVVVKPHDEPVAGPLDELAEYRDLLDGLPHERFVHGYLARAGARSLQSIDRTVRAAAAAADLGGGNMRIRVRARHDAEPGECSAGRGGDELLDAADPGAALYLEVPSIGCAIRGLAGR